MESLLESTLSSILSKVRGDFGGAQLWEKKGLGMFRKLCQIVVGSIFFMVTQTNPADACSEAGFDKLTDRLLNKEAIHLCSHHRIFLYQRCVQRGGSDEFTQNCDEHTLPIDNSTKNRGLFLTSEQRIANYWHCYKPDRNGDCCDHITVSDQHKIGACGKDKTSKKKAKQKPRKFIYSIEVTCLNTSVFDSTSRFRILGESLKSCTEARSNAKSDAEVFCERRNKDEEFVSLRHISSCS